MKYQAAALALLLHTSTVLAGVRRRDDGDRRWTQCAGQNYNGPTDCPSGWTCQFQNPCMSYLLLNTTLSVVLGGPIYPLLPLSDVTLRWLQNYEDQDARNRLTLIFC